jgi:hypothetical protein
MVVLGSLVLTSHHGTGTEARPDLSSPKATMRTYCKTENPSLIRQLFHPEFKPEEESLRRPIWTECKVIKASKTRLSGKPLGGGLVAMQGDTEVVIEVKMIDPAKGNPKTRIWHLLRNFKGEWKIISVSHIPDKNYPAQD